ncbi:MAG: hypothetical protein P0S94_01670 [Simkaniaceae bacterium]|nr:hypothetical protein [Simkaniaceae bacterium]
MGKLVWKGLFLVTGIIALWFSVKLGRELYPYLTLSHRSKAHSVAWSVVPIGASKFGVKGVYTYFLNESEYGGVHLFKKPIFINMRTAEKHIAAWGDHTWDVWMNPSHPEKSSMQHIFPFSALVQFILSIGVFLYFQWLRQYAAQRA